MCMWLPKIIDFRQIFGEKNFMDPLFYSKIQKILFLINIIILIAYYFKKDFENESQENFCKNTSKKEMVFFFTSVFENLSYDSFLIFFYLICCQKKNNYKKKIFLNFRVPILRDPRNFFLQISVRNLIFDNRMHINEIKIF